MAPSYFSFNTYTLRLSSPPPLSSLLIKNLSGNIVQGITRIGIDYNQLNFNVKPFKVYIDWGYNGQTLYLNDYYVLDTEYDPLSTYSPLLSSQSYTVVSPSDSRPFTISPTIKIYYENGCITTFVYNIDVCPDNIIDMDLNVLDIQNIDKPFNTVYNLQSNKGNVVYNVTDLQDS